MSTLPFGVLMQLHELSDAQYALIALHPGWPEQKGGRPWADHRCMLNGLFCKLRTSAHWRAIPERYGSEKMSSVERRTIEEESNVR